MKYFNLRRRACGKPAVVYQKIGIAEILSPRKILACMCLCVCGVGSGVGLKTFQDTLRRDLPALGRAVPQEQGFGCSLGEIV